MDNQNKKLFFLLISFQVIIIVYNISNIIENTDILDNHIAENDEQVNNLRTSLKGNYSSSILLLLSIIISSIISKQNLNKNTINYTFFLSIIFVIISSFLINNITNINYRNTTVKYFENKGNRAELNTIPENNIENWTKKLTKLINILSDIKMYDTIWLVILIIQIVICIIAFIISIVSKKTINMVTYKNMGLVIMMVAAPMLLNFIPKMIVMYKVHKDKGHPRAGNPTDEISPPYLENIKNKPLGIIPPLIMDYTKSMGGTYGLSLLCMVFFLLFLEYTISIIFNIGKTGKLLLGLLLIVLFITFYIIDIMH